MAEFANNLGFNVDWSRGTNAGDVNRPYIPPAPRPYVIEEGDWIRARTLGIMPLRSPVPGDILNGLQAQRYALIAKNPVVKSALDTILIGVFWGRWEIESGNNYELHPEFEAIDDVMIKSIHAQTSTLEYETFDNVLRSIMRDSMVYGFSISEIIFNTEDEYAEVGEHRVKAIKTKAPFEFDFWVDEVGNLDRIYYRPFGLFREREELNKFVIATYPHLIDGNYYGTSEMQSILQDVQLLEVVEENQAQGIARLAVRPTILHTAQNMSESEKGAIEQAIYNSTSGSLISLPASIDPETGELKKTHEITVMDDRASHEGVGLIKDVIDMLQKRVLRTLGVPDDLGYTSTDVGSLAKAKEEMNMFIARLIFKQKYIESVVNRQIIPAMTVYNWRDLPRDYVLPRFKFGAMDEYYTAQMTEVSLRLYHEGILTADEVRENLDLGPMPRELRDIADAKTDAQESTLDRVAATGEGGEVLE